MPIIAPIFHELAIFNHHFDLMQFHLEGKTHANSHPGAAILDLPLWTLGLPCGANSGGSGVYPQTPGLPVDPTATNLVLSGVPLSRKGVLY